MHKLLATKVTTKGNQPGQKIDTIKASVLSKGPLVKERAFSNEHARNWGKGWIIGSTSNG